METAEYEIMYRVEETHWWYRALHRLIFAQLNKHAPDWRNLRILDAGCGTGAILQRLGNAQCHTGVDLSTDAISFCHKRGLDNAMPGDICALPFPDGSFDVIICSSVLYHRWVKDVPLALRELRRVCREGGLLLLNLPAYDFLHSAHDEAVFTARRFTRSQVRILLKENGFEVRTATYWTTLLFPLALLARTLKGSSKGRDFDDDKAPSGLVNALFNFIMWIEHGLMQLFSLPFGVGLFCVAEVKPRAK